MKNQNNLFSFTLAFLSVILLSVDIASQSSSPPQLNEEFLNSLPENVREELLDEMNRNKPSQQIDYGAFSTLIDKNSAEDFIDQELLKLESPKDLKDLMLEDLRPFGEDFFSGYPSTFLPVTEPGLGSNYVLSAGDVLSISISGAIESSSDLPISRMGYINIPKVGKLQLAGLTIDQANSKLSDFVQSRYIGSETSLTLSGLADMQVILSGYVEVPGIYTLGGGNSILGAIRAAGGIASNGSYRNINLKRDGQTIANLDLYRLLISGDLTLDIPLRAGDIIHVEYAKKVVNIYGGVKRPAKFEVLNENLAELIEYAGGSFSDSMIDSASLANLIDNQYLATEVKSKDFNSTPLQANDVVYIPFFTHSFEGFINFEGAFLKIGKFSSGSNLEFLSSKENLAADAYPLAFLVKDFDISSKTSRYSLVEKVDTGMLSSGDSVIALSKGDIEFINSIFLRDFFNNPVMTQEIQSCSMFKKLYDARLSSSFQAANKVLNSFRGASALNDTTESVLQQQLLDKKLLVENNPRLPQSSNLFNQAGNCLSDFNTFFDSAPEALLFLILNSVNIEGTSFASGLFPASSTATLDKYISYTQIYSNTDSPQKLFLSTPLSTIAIEYADAKEISVKPGYSINFPNKKINDANMVTISGAVNNPGRYFLSPNTKLSQLISMAGGYKGNAYPVGGVLHRESAKRIEAEYHQRLYDDLIQTLSSELTQGSSISFDGLNLILSEFKSIKPSGRVIAEFNPAILSKNPSTDIILEHQDAISIPPRSNIVYVLGEVLTPGPQNYNSNYNYQDYIARAGGLTEFVQKRSIIQILPNGESRRLKPGLFNDFITDSAEILPGTVIYATKDVAKINNLRLASTLAPVISSIAISLASLNSISSN
jgi:polysaccharide biosynthesis/export protein